MTTEPRKVWPFTTDKQKMAIVLAEFYILIMKYAFIADAIVAIQNHTTQIFVLLCNNGGLLIYCGPFFSSFEIDGIPFFSFSVVPFASEGRTIKMHCFASIFRFGW